MALRPRPWQQRSLLPKPISLHISRTSSRRLLRFLAVLAVLALLPPVFFHFRLRRSRQMRIRRCRWLQSPPLVCAHGSDPSRSPPNTIDAFRAALQSHVDCIEIDLSRSSDGVLYALHDRDLQRMSGNYSAKVGYMGMNEIKKLNAASHLVKSYHNQGVPTVEDALEFVSDSVRQVILDAKIGPPLYERGLAGDILSVINKTSCRNCLIWTKSDVLGRNVIKLSKDVQVGYIVMIDPLTGARNNLFRLKGAAVAGVYHPLIDENLIKVLHRGAKKVYAWTVDDSQSMKRMLLEHVDAIVTGNPSLLQGIMDEMKMECLEEGFLLP